jgi:hypothetical protein
VLQECYKGDTRVSGTTGGRRREVIKTHEGKHTHKFPHTLTSSCRPVARARNGGQGGSKPSTRMLQTCHNSVTRALQSVSRVLQKCHNSVSRALHECYKSVTEVLKGVTRVSRGRYEGRGGSKPSERPSIQKF